MTTTDKTETNTSTSQEPELDIVIPPAEDNNEEEGQEIELGETPSVALDYDKAFAKLPAHIKKAAELFGYKPTAESQDKLEEMVTKLKADYETELNASVVPLIVAKMKGDKKIEKPGIQPNPPENRKRLTSPYRGY